MMSAVIYYAFLYWPDVWLRLWLTLEKLTEGDACRYGSRSIEC